eukprot:1658763-Heterocapsa_arctica.AAC.1
MDGDVKMEGTAMIDEGTKTLMVDCKMNVGDGPARSWAQSRKMEGGSAQRVMATGGHGWPQPHR